MSDLLLWYFYLATDKIFSAEICEELLCRFCLSRRVIIYWTAKPAVFFNHSYIITFTEDGGYMVVIYVFSSVRLLVYFLSTELLQKVMNGFDTVTWRGGVWSNN